jgi:CheY-like chemotaxis protein
MRKDRLFSSDDLAGIPVYPMDVFLLTDAGQAQIAGGSTRLAPEALSVLVLLDGKSTVGDLEQKIAHLPAGEVRKLLRSLLSAQLVRQPSIAETDGLDFSAFFDAARSDPEPSAGAQASAEREAEIGAPNLARDGYYVSIARQALEASPLEPGRRLSALIVEDDADLSALLERFLNTEGFDVVIAADRRQFLAKLRQPPAPDVVILDVKLPDANGFDILRRLKGHAALKSVPVIMLTAEASRESVLRGLASGADGYITKPFKKAMLLGGIKAVLGIT